MKEEYKLCESQETLLEYSPSPYKTSNATIVVLPGGAYAGLARHEGEGYAQIFNMFGMDAFVLKYRVAPCRFPDPLLDARRAVRFLRANAENFGIDKNKILVIGSSAGGHLAALLSTCTEKLDGERVDEIDLEEYLPNGQILCYPVISSLENVGHMGSYENLLGENFSEKDKFSPDKLVAKTTPKAFIWHTSSDGLVSVVNSYRYAEVLANHGVLCELHVFPVGGHGCGVCSHVPYTSKWVELLRQWLLLNEFI